MIVVGLTGGIASGKSLVAEMLAAKGASVIRADIVGHESYRRGTETYREVVQAFGEGILSPEGEIDRSVLGRRVFANAEERRRLEAIVWPEVLRRVEDRLIAMHGEGIETAVVEAAPLIESNLHSLVHEVWVVTAPPEAVRERAMARSGLAPADTEARIAAQLSNEERLRHADIVIENSGSVEELRRNVDLAWAGLQSRAGSKRKVE